MDTSFFKSFYDKLNDFRYRIFFRERDNWIVKKYSLPLLSKEEILLIREKWPFLYLSNRDLIWSRMYKQEYGFSPYIVTDII